MIMGPSPESIKRNSPPNIYDQAPLGSTCLVIEANRKTWYIQTSSDEENPIWMLAGPVIEKDDIYRLKIGPCEE
jgi:hypothetical protein